MGTIISRKKGKATYYIYQESYREKIDKNDSGKTRGSGKSRVLTRSIYLGSAEYILSCVKEKRKPLSIKVRQFGLIAAAYQASNKIELQQILIDHLKGNQHDIPIWIYFFITIINRLDYATSKNQMAEWLKKTILPELMGVDPNKFTSKNFWYAMDNVIPEKEIQKQREAEETENDLFVGIDDSVFNKIETELFYSIDKLMGLSPDIVCYDTTNFYTYIEEPAKSKLANSCYSKDSKHHLKHVGLLMAVEKSCGIPLISRVYRANKHDSKVFSFILSDLIIALKKICHKESDLILVLDKGNNSKENFSAMSGKISWVGALVPSNYKDLMDLELNEYHGIWKNMSFYRCDRTVMDIECTVIVSFNSKTKRKQEHTLKRNIEKLKEEIINKWDSYKRLPKKITKGIESIKEKSRCGKYINIELKDKKLYFTEIKGEIEKSKKMFGKNIIFSNMKDAETGFLIDTYIEKNIIEDDFKILKDTAIIRFRPIRHWTDSKIRAYAFCCVISMTLIRVMQWMAEQAGYKMSPHVLKEELKDMEEIVMVYSKNEAERRITEPSSVQKKLWEVFYLEDVKQMLSLH